MNATETTKCPTCGGTERGETCCPPCRYCDASLPGIDGMCLEHAKAAARALQTYAERVTDYLEHVGDEDCECAACELRHAGRAVLP